MPPGGGESPAIAFCTNAFPRGDIAGALPKLAALGYDGVEFWQQYIEWVGAGRVRGLAAVSGLAVAQLCPYFDVTSSALSCRRAGTLARGFLALAAETGCRLVRVFTGPVASAAATPAGWRRAADTLAAMCEAAQRRGIRLALETHRGSLMDSAAATLRLLRDVGSPALGVNLQPPLAGEDFWDTVEALAPYTIHAHVHNRDDLGQTFLDAGKIDIGRFYRILASHGFNGYLSVEHAGHRGRHDPWETARRDARFLRSLGGRLSA